MDANNFGGERDRSFPHSSWERRSVWVDPTHRMDFQVSPEHPENPVLFVHGWGLSTRSYADPLALMAQWAQVYAPSLPGFGGTSALPPGTAPGLEGYGDAILTLWEAADLPHPMPVVAHSMGAGIAMKMALKRPDLVSDLTLVCPIGGNVDEQLPWRNLVASLLSEMYIGFIPRLFDAGPTMIRHPLTAAKSALAARNAMLSPDLYQIIKADIPTTLIIAESDGILRPGWLPCTGAHVVDVQGGHSFLLRQPELFDTVVRASIDAHRA